MRLSTFSSLHLSQFSGTVCGSLRKRLMNKFLVLTTILAALIRLLTLLNLPLLYDESFDILLSRNSNFFIRSTAIIEGHPPLHFFISNLWQSYSQNLYFNRLLSLMFGVSSVAFIGIVGKKLFNEKVGSTAALLTTISPIHIFYSSVARVYSLTMLETVFIIYFFTQFLRSKTRILPLTIFLILAIYTHYFFIIMLIAFNVYLNFKRKISKKWIFANSSIFVFCIPLFYMILITPKFQAHPYQSPFKFAYFYLTSFIPWDIIQNLKLYTLGRFDSTSILAIFLTSISLVLFLVAIIKMKKVRSVQFLAFIYLATPIIITAISYLLTPISGLRSFTIFNPLFIFVIALFTTTVQIHKRFMLIAVLTMLTLFLWKNILFEQEDKFFYQELYQNLKSDSVVVYNDVTLFLPSQILKPKGEHLLIFQGHLRPETYRALGVNITQFSDIPKSWEIYYFRLPTRWPPYEKEAAELELYLKNNFQGIDRHNYRKFQIIHYTKRI